MRNKTHKTRNRIFNLEQDCVFKDCFNFICKDCAISSKFAKIIGMRMEEMAKWV